jgi:hypothetical protein
VLGTWAYNATGSAIPTGTTTPVPVTFIGVLTANYSAKVTGPGTFIPGGSFPGTPIQAGMILEYNIVDGSIQLNSDCTGILSYTMQVAGFPVLLGPVVERIVVLPDKGEILSMSIYSPISKPMWAYTAKRMIPVPASVSWPQAPVPAGSGK